MCVYSKKDREKNYPCVYIYIHKYAHIFLIFVHQLTFYNFLKAEKKRKELFPKLTLWNTNKMIKWIRKLVKERYNKNIAIVEFFLHLLNVKNWSVILNLKTKITNAFRKPEYIFNIKEKIDIWPSKEFKLKAEDFKF